MASSLRPQRTNTQCDYLAMNLGYEDNIPTEDQYPDFPTETSFSDIHETIQTIDPSLDLILLSESALQTILPDPDTSLLLSITVS